MDRGFMDKVRSFFGLGPEPPRNDFRNPIWGSDDDDDDGDELYTRQNMDLQSNVDFHSELTRHMHDMIRSFGGMFGDMKTLFNDDHLEHFDTFTNTPSLDSDTPVPDTFDSNRIRDYYLKPGYHKKRDEPKDVDLDGEILSHEIPALLKKKDEPNIVIKPFDGNLVQGLPFCQTIITTSVKKSDGTVETRRIVKRGNKVIEETTTSSEPGNNGPHSPGLNSVSSPAGFFVSQLGSLFHNFY